MKDERELTPKQEATWLWFAGGCGCLLLMGLVLVPPAFLFLRWRSSPGSDPGSEVLAPAAPVAPVAPVAPTLPGSPPSVPGAPTTPGIPLPPGGSGLPPPPGPATDSRTVRVRVTDVSGTSAVRAGATCSFPVTRHTRTDGTFWCRAEVECGGVVFYGGGNAGYFDCTLYEQPERHVVGRDPNSTRVDGDGAMRLDTLRGEFEMHDDTTGALGEFTLRAQVTGVE